MHEKVQENSHFLDDYDDVSLIEYDNWERFKPFVPKKGTTIGGTSLIPIEDNDQKYVPYDIQGESVWTNPPDSNMLSLDHGLDEDYVWAFQKTVFNQDVIKNPFLQDPLGVSRRNNLPPWGEKLIAPSFFREEKFKKLMRQ